MRKWIVILNDDVRSEIERLKYNLWEIEWWSVILQENNRKEREGKSMMMFERKNIR